VQPRQVFENWWNYSVFYHCPRCELLEMNGTHYCEWTYNGLGLDYQILAGPSCIAVYTIMGVILGIVADRFNR
jgi:hypothetical protein